MPKYKPGDVAALFPKPKVSMTESGKKLQSLFSEFHTNKNKPLPQVHTQPSKKIKAKNENFKKMDKEDPEPQSLETAKNKKRKFLFSGVESNIEHVMKKINLELDGPKQSEALKVKEMEKNNSLSEIDFPRRKKKKTKFNLNFSSSITEDSSSEQKNKFNGSYEINAPQQVKGFIKPAKFQRQSIGNDSDKKFETADNKNPQHTNKTSKVIGYHQVKGFIKKAKHQNHIVANDKIETFKTADTKSNQHSNKTSKIDSHHLVKSFVKKPKHQNRKIVSDAIKNLKVCDSENPQDTPKYEVVNNNSLIESQNEKQGVKKRKRKQKRKKLTSEMPEVSNKLQFINTPDQPDFINLKNVDQEEILSRTLFVGNLPTNSTRKALAALFSVFGPVENVRYFAIETDRKKIFKSGGPKLHNFNYAATSVPAFIVFKERKSAVEALSLSGSFFQNRHITVDFALPAGTKKIYDSKRTVFIGNLPFDIDEENIWTAFAECGKIEGVRVIRDHQTGIGKGFGYVLFSCVQSKEKALALENLKIEERNIRIKDADYKQTQKSYEKKNNRDPFKSRAISFKKRQKDGSSRKSVNKIMKKNKNLHNKKKIASLMLKSWK